jgi:CheY-like chemotaxis protein
VFKRWFPDENKANNYVIFVLTSEESTTQTIVEIVREEGYQIVAADTGEEAIALLDQPPLPDVLILDLMITDMDTPKFLEIVRNRLGRGNLPPIILLGSDEAGEALAHELEVEDYMQKPFSSEELLTHIGQLLVEKPKE